MDPKRIVGIGASANGLEAINEFFDNIPDDTGMAFVIIQHLSPDFKSLMDHLLVKHTSMPVKVIQEDIRPEPNHIYLIPSESNIVIERGVIKRVDRTNHTVNLPVDIFFHSLGLDQGDHSVGVILSGASTDGSRGTRTIKEAGGLVLVQDPETTSFDGMPQATIDLGIADLVLPPFSLAKELVRIINKPQLLPPKQETPDDGISEEILHKILDRVAEVTNVDFTEYRTGTLVRRTEKRMHLNNIYKIEDYYYRLLEDEEECRGLFKEFLIGVTRFFRDKEAFESLRKNVLPEIIARTSPNQEIRIWVAGCASGEEAYSIGILLKEYLEEKRTKRHFKIFATDVDKDAINFASEGNYSSNIAADVDAVLLDKYFTHRHNRYIVQKFLRENIVFAAHDALQDPPFIHMDLISCRNMPIYLNPKMQQNLYRNFQFALNYGGYLFLGPSETVGSTKKAFELIDNKWKIYKNISAIKLGHMPGHRQFYRDRKYNSEESRYFTPDYTAYTKISESTFSGILAQRFAPRAMFVNENQEILYLNGDFDELLQFPKGMKLNLTEVIGDNDNLIFLNGIRKVEENNTPVVYRNIPFRKKSKEFILDLKFERFNPKELNALPLYLIEFHIKGESEQKVDPDAEEVNLEDYKDERLLTLEHELQKVRLERQSLFEQLETANEELQSSNEELLASNEELQSTNEELQSLNEELYTVNTELQSKIEELTIIHTDTNNLLKSTEIGTIFLDPHLRIRKFTPPMQQQFHLLHSDIGRPITHFTNSFKGADIYTDIKKVLEDLHKIERQVTDTEGNLFLMRILPYRTESNVINGVVITFVNLNNLQEAMVENEESNRKFRALFEHASEQFIITDRKGIILEVNFPIKNFLTKNAIGKNIIDQVGTAAKADFEKAIDHAVEKGKTTTLKHKLNPPGADQLSLSTKIAPIVMNGKLKYLVVITSNKV